MAKLNKLFKKKLSSKNVISILKEVQTNEHLFSESKGFKREIGMDGSVSNFKDMKFYKFPRKMKEIVKDNMPPEWRGNALESIALTSGNEFNLDNKDITLNAGDMIKFTPTLRHCVTDVKKAQYYLVALIMPIS
jgi:hypothetical protein